MASTQTYYTIENENLYRIEENDGARYVRRGLERTKILLCTVEEAVKKYPHELAEASPEFKKRLIMQMKLPVDYTRLTRSERRMVREEYIRLQEGKCSHCKAPLDESASPDVMEKEIDLKMFPTGFLDWPVHLHHCHKTGMTIGAVHCHCNAVLWQYHGE